MLVNRRLILAHFWLAFAVFGLALFLGAWQMLVRSPLYTWIGNPEWYYRSLTAHGTAMAYVFPTLVAMGFCTCTCFFDLAQIWSGWSRKSGNVQTST